MPGDTYLTTAEAADYLKLKERKLYELVAEAAIPCTKVTGKWLFPRASLDRWLEAGMTGPAAAARAAPPVIAGSHDLLLEWAARDSVCGLALLAEGSSRGLERLAAGEAAVAAIHFHATDESDPPNLAAVSARADLADAVVVSFCRREQGLVVAPGNPLGLAAVEDAVARKARFAVRQPGAGAQLLLEAILARAGIAAGTLAVAAGPCATGSELALAVRVGRADCGIASRGVAETHGLAFLPLAWERFDLALRRRTYFEPGPQRLFALMRTPAFVARAAEFGGYDVSEAGTILLNR
ncbi:helix-turn-helix transcriptional regulator [Chthonobacter albigriseus]|uniref:helix-turn-helix transcriptional regulator n=1 Tax=Chthonobacter albigriseus TaxID=1683161 RepID=UPI0015EE3DAE|nr:helix-turn-helix transcriptional regulator [Chthonobacter albigriseus]